MVQEVLLDWPGAEIDPILDTSVDATVDVEEHPPNMAAIVNLEELGRNIVVEVKSSRERQERGQRRADQDVPHVSAVRKRLGEPSRTFASNVAVMLRPRRPHGACLAPGTRRRVVSSALLPEHEEALGLGYTAVQNERV